VPRLNNETLTVGIVAVFVGLAGAYGFRYFAKEPAAPPPPRSTNVPLVSNNLPAGKTVAMGDIMLVPMTPQQMFEKKLSADTMLGTDQIVGRVLREPLDKGSPFLTTSFYPQGMGPDLSERLKPGERGVTIQIQNAASIAGFAGPGSMVDVLFRSRARTEDRQYDEVKYPETTMTLLDGVQVLALGRDSTPGTVATGDPDSVTLAVSAEQAAALKAVEGRGELSLALRGPKEVPLTSAPKKVTLDGLLGIQEPPKPFVAEIYRGGTRQTVDFQGQAVRDESFGGFDVNRMAPVNQPYDRTTGNPSQPTGIVGNSTSFNRGNE
jgi:Flp pilus assembly protein CpaB